MLLFSSIHLILFQMFLFSDAPVFQFFPVFQMLLFSSVPVFKHSFDPIFDCSCFQVFLFSNFSCFSDAAVFQCPVFKHSFDPIFK